MALSETRLSGETGLEEFGAGYMFLCIGHAEGPLWQAGVGFGIRSLLAARLEQRPHDITSRLMTLTWYYRTEHMPLCHPDQYLLSHNHSSWCRKGDILRLCGLDTPHRSSWASFVLHGRLQCASGWGHIGMVKDPQQSFSRQYEFKWKSATASSTRTGHNKLAFPTNKQIQKLLAAPMLQTIAHAWLYHHPAKHVNDVHITSVMRGTSQWSDHQLVAAVSL